MPGRSLAALLLTLLLTLPALSVELFRYRYHADNGEKLQYIFEADEQRGPKTVREGKAAEIAADWVIVFYHVLAGVILHWLFCFLDTLRLMVALFYLLVPTSDERAVEYMKRECNESVITS
jgi:hypothetical protein